MRIVLFFFLLIVSYYISDPFHEFILGSLAYKIPPGFFIDSWADWSLAWFLTFTLLGGIIFGALGKKIDYFFIALLIALDIWEWTGTDNITQQIWITLIGTIIVSNILGYILKLLRQKFLPKLKI